MSSSGTTPEPQKKRVVIALPGNTFSDKFLVSLVRSLHTLWESGKYAVVLSPAHSSFVSFARAKTMGLDVMRGAEQTPFPNMPYDVYVTIDSDVVFEPHQLIELIECTDVHPVVCGYYMMGDNQHIAAVRDWDPDFFLKHGSFQFLTPSSVETFAQETGQRFMEVAYAGMGFFAVRRDVFERPGTPNAAPMRYPYFHTPLERFERPDGTVVQDQSSEDTSFCKNLQAAGYRVMMHVGLRVGHYKPFVI